MNTFTNRKLAVCFPGDGKRQSAFGVPILQTDINKRHPQATPTFPSIERQREQTRGCSGEYVVKEEINSEIMRLRYGFTASAELLALWASYGYGSAATPTGTIADEVQTVTLSNPSTLIFAHEGLTGTTASLATTTTAAQLQSALEKLDSIKPGNVQVTGVTLAAGLTVTFKNSLAKAALPLITAGTPANATIARTTAGSNKIHLIGRSTSEIMTLFGLIIGFDGDSTDADRYNDLALNSMTVTVPKAGKATCELDIFGSAKTVAAVAYVKPACQRVEPIYARDCRAKLDGEFNTKKLFEMRWSYSNNIVTDTDAQDWDSIDISNLERGDRTTTYSVTHYGTKGDSMRDKAAQNPEPVAPIELHFGRPGDRFSWYAPLAVMRLDDARTTFIGSKNKTAYTISGEAFENEDTGEVDYIEANIAKASAFLVASA